MKTRVILILKSFGTLAICGLLYYTLFSLTGLGLLCPLNLTTGLLCPFCGVSRMLISLLKFDFEAAFYYNGAIMILMPFWITVCMFYLYDYTKTGNKRFKKWMIITVYITLAIMLIFGILRNITSIGLTRSDSELINKFFGG